MHFLNNPGGWLDLLTAITIAAGIILVIIVLCLDPSLLRGSLKFWATTALGMVFLLGSADSIYTRKIAPRYGATGIISAVDQHGGKNPRTYFRLNTTDGGYFRLCAKTESGDLQNGETITAEWMIFDADVLHYRVLTGPHRGNHFQDVIGFEAIVEPIFGLFLIGGAFRLWRRDPLGHPQKPSGRERAPDGVDDQSLLHLNRD